MQDSPPTILLAYTASRKSQQIYHRLCVQSGYQVVHANTGHEAAERLKTRCFDAIVCDISLPPLDAWRLTRLVRSGAMATPANTPVVIVSTTFSERIAEATAKEIEANAFLPFSQLEQLPNVLAGILSDKSAKPPRSRLLVVEDYPDTVNLVQRVLGSRFDIDVALNGEEGLALWMEKQHDIVLLDLMLPKMAGEEVLEAIIAQKPSQSVVMMTAHGDAERAASLLLKGAMDFIAKPFRADALRQVVNIAAHAEDYLVSNQQFIDSQVALAKEKERAQVTLASIGEGVITTDAAGNIEYLNPVAEALTGWTNEEVRNKPLRDIFETYHEYSRVPALNPLDRCLREQRRIDSTSNMLLRNRYAKELVIEHSAAPIRDKNDRIAGAVMVFRDNTEARQMARQLSFHASHDALTGLNNREMLDRAVQSLLNDVAETGNSHSFLHLDLNQFKMVNDSCGHAAGDRLLQEMAQILASQIRMPTDTLARMGGDEFGILLRACPLDAAERIASDICHAIEDYEFTYEDHSYKIGVSIGITPINQDTLDLQDALSSAETACRMAKERGGSRYHVFREDDHEQSLRRSEMRVIAELVRAEKENRFVLYCQQVAPASSREKPSYEILLRLRDDDGKIVAPGYFLGAAERYNLMPKIDRWVMRNAFAFISEHPELYRIASHFAINLSGLSLSDDSCYLYIQQLLNDTGIAPEKICFEITETAAIGNFVRAGGFIGAIRELGCKFALDDFGSGMSSFAYLKRLPVDFLKIDGMFVKGMLDDTIDLAMVRSINDIGHVLKLKTVAEFVENEEILNKLQELGVDYFQGYHIAKPMPLEDLLKQVGGARRSG